MNSETGLFGQFNGLIGSAVRVESKDLTFTTGVLYCIDPESDSVVLLSAHEKSSKSEHGADQKWGVKVLLGHSVIAIHADDQAADSETLESIRYHFNVSDKGAKLHGDGEDYDSGALLGRRQQLCAFLRQVRRATQAAPIASNGIYMDRTDCHLCVCDCLLFKRFIPCEESAAAGIVVFGGAARISTPFTCESIECTNEQILARLQQLLVQFDLLG